MEDYGLQIPTYSISIVRDYLKDIYNTEALDEDEFEIAKAVVDKICALADKAEITLDDKVEVEEARAAFEALDKKLQDLLLAPVNKYYENTLQEAEAKIEELEKAADDQAIKDAIAKVVDLELEEVTEENIKLVVEELIENENIAVTIEVLDADKGTYRVDLRKGEATASKEIMVTKKE